MAIKVFALLPAFGITAVLSAPQGIGSGVWGNAGQDCSTERDMSTMKTVKTYTKEEDWGVFGPTCTSGLDASAYCNIGRGATWDHTTTWSVGGGVSLAYNKGPWDIGAHFDFGYSWSNSVGGSLEVNANCPIGGLQCGMYPRVTMCVIEGTMTWKYKNAALASGCNAKHDDIPFTISSVCTRGDQPNPDANAVVDFKACLLKCTNANKCVRAEAKKMPLCPGTSRQDAFPDGEDDPANPDPGHPDDGGKPGPKGCTADSHALIGQCKPEEAGEWNCVKGESWQRCSSGSWSLLTPLPAGAWCDCGIKGRDWNPSDPTRNVPPS